MRRQKRRREALPNKAAEGNDADNEAEEDVEEDVGEDVEEKSGGGWECRLERVGEAASGEPPQKILKICRVTANKHMSWLWELTQRKQETEQCLRKNIFLKSIAQFLKSKLAIKKILSAIYTETLIDNDF